MTYQFKHSYMRFQKGGLDEKIALDRYATPEHRIENMKVGDIVVCKLDRKSDKRVVGEIVNIDDLENVVVRTRELMIEDGKEVLVEEEKTFHHELITKPLELSPESFWNRWSKAAASVELLEKQEEIENQFREYFDGYGGSPGGRIQLAAGQEYITGKRANLTIYNCFVIPSPSIVKEDWDKIAGDEYEASKTMQAILDKAILQAQIMARGGGVGINASTIPGKIKGAGSNPNCVVLYLPYDHKDIDILKDMIKLGKFNEVTVLTHKPNFNNYHYLKVEDSREGLLEGVKWMVDQLYKGNKVVIDFSDIRHKGALVRGVNGRSSGAPSWMELYNVVAGLLHMKYFDAVDCMEIFSKITLLVEQGGSRRGAKMIILNCDHPNIRKFITRKRTMGYIQGANISVGISNSFMEKATQEGTEEAEIWDLIIESAWASAEPGVVFLERYNQESNSWYFAPIVATNP